MQYPLSTKHFQGTPGDVINVRMQNDIKLPFDLRRNYSSVVDGLITIVRYEGFRALFNGTSMATTRAVLMNIGQLSMYDQFKMMLLTKTPDGVFKDDYITHVLASMMASTTGTTLTQPLDVIKTRFMNATTGDYKGIRDVAASVYRDYGLIGYFRGFTPALVRLMPQTVLTFVFLEKMTNTFGKPVYTEAIPTMLSLDET